MSVRLFETPTPHPRFRADVSLVELMVMITIVASLVGLLLPAVNASRERARR